MFFSVFCYNKMWKPHSYHLADPRWSLFIANPRNYFSFCQLIDWKDTFIYWLLYSSGVYSCKALDYLLNKWKNIYNNVLKKPLILAFSETDTDFSPWDPIPVCNSLSACYLDSLLLYRNKNRFNSGQYNPSPFSLHKNDKWLFQYHWRL